MAITTSENLIREMAQNASDNVYSHIADRPVEGVGASALNCDPDQSCPLSVTLDEYPGNPERFQFHDMFHM